MFNPNKTFQGRNKFRYCQNVLDFCSMSAYLFSLVLDRHKITTEIFKKKNGGVNNYCFKTYLKH